MKCLVCNTEYTGKVCPTCKEQVKKLTEIDKKINSKEEPVKEEEVMTKEDYEKLESVIFEDDVKVKLRNGKVYSIIPATLKEARILMQKLKTVNPDFIISNFLDPELEDQPEDFIDNRINDLYDILMIGFKGYPSVDKEFLEDNVDVVMAKNIIDVLLGLSALKK